MKISCDIIRDILPLYAENMTSQASNEMVEEHLGECEGCKGYLDALRRPVKLPVETTANSFEKVGKTIHNKVVLTALVVVFAMFSVLFGVTSWLIEPVWLDAEEAVVSVEETDDGGIQFFLADYVLGTTSFDWEENSFYMWHTTRLDYILEAMETVTGDNEVRPNSYIAYGRVRDENGRIHSYLPGESDQGEVINWATEWNYWSINVYDGTPETLLWDGGQPVPEQPLEKFVPYVFGNPIKPNLWGAVAAFAIFTAMAMTVKKPVWKEFFIAAAMAAGSLVFSVVLITGCRFAVLSVSAEAYTTLKRVYVFAGFLTVTMILLRRLHRLTKYC